MSTGFPTTFFMLLLAGAVASANVNRITYQGRIIKPDGSPVRANTSFRFVIKSPNACTLWQEDQLIDLTETNGAFSAIIGGGTNSASGSHTFSEIFDKPVS